jgi:hypothetical protein
LKKEKNTINVWYNVRGIDNVNGPTVVIFSYIFICLALGELNREMGDFKAPIGWYINLIYLRKKRTRSFPAMS